MKKNIAKIAFVILLIIIAIPVQASSIMDNLKQTGGQAYYGDTSTEPKITDPAIIIGNAIQIALGFIGIIFTILILISGYQWMTAGGNAETITKAKKRIINATIGLIIALSVFSITYFVIGKSFVLIGTN